MVKFLATMILLASSIANADWLQCDKADQSTQIEFYNHFGKITFQLGAPYQGEYLYLLGNCYSENEVGLPYSCEPFNFQKVQLNLIKGQHDQPVAEITTLFDDGTSTKESIGCEHFD